MHSKDPEVQAYPVWSRQSNKASVAWAEQRHKVGGEGHQRAGIRHIGACGYLKPVFKTGWDEDPLEEGHDLTYIFNVLLWLLIWE